MRRLLSRLFGTAHPQSPIHRPHRSHRPFSTGLELLEGRDVPATASFSAGVLTITANEGDAIAINGPSGSYVAGGLAVTANSTTIFDSTGSHQIPKAVVVKMNSVSSASLDVNVNIYGNLTVYGAKSNSTADFGGIRVLGNLTYTATGGANDTITWGQTITPAVYGNMTLSLGGGTNSVTLLGAYVYGNLSITAGAGQDDITLGSTNSAYPLNVFGAAIFNLGNGQNTVTANAGGVKVKGAFSYTGGTGVDVINFGTNASPLSVGGGLSANLGTTGAGTNSFYTSQLDVGGAMSVFGGSGIDMIQFDGFSSSTRTNIGKNLTLELGNGDNYLYAYNVLAVGGSLNYFGTKQKVNGAWVYSGSTSSDLFYLLKGTIARSASVNLGNSQPGNTQYVTFGSTGFLVIGGSLTVTGGNVSEDVAFTNVYIGAGLTMNLLGGNDIVSIDDSAIAGATAVHFGSGNDEFYADHEDETDFPLETSFGGAVSLYGDAGDDYFNLSYFGGNLVRFGGKVSIWGSTGTDTLENYASNQFYVSSNFEDCENGDL